MLMYGTNSSVAQDKFMFASLCVSLRVNTHTLCISFICRLSMCLHSYSDCFTHSLFSLPPPYSTLSYLTLRMNRGSEASAVVVAVHMQWAGPSDDALVHNAAVSSTPTYIGTAAAQRAGIVETAFAHICTTRSGQLLKRVGILDAHRAAATVGFAPVSSSTWQSLARKAWGR